MANNKERRNIEITTTRREAGITATAAILAAATVGLVGYSLGKENSDQPIATSATSGIVEPGTMPSVSPEITLAPGVIVTMPPATEAPVSFTPGASESAPAMLSAIRIESAQTAATRFGADAYSKNPSNWEINEYGGAHLKETAKAVKVNTAGAVLEGWIKANMVGARDALTVVADSNVPVVEVNGGTLWDFGSSSREGFAQVLGQVRAKEAVEQPDVTVVPLCADLTPINTTDVYVNKVESAQAAASMFGADDYSRNPSNWEINEWGGAHLKETNAASLINLNGAVLEGWVKADRENGRDAITFVTHPNVSQMRTNGGTLWNFADSNRGFQQLLGQVIAKEAVEQPDVTVLPAYNCAITN